MRDVERDPILLPGLQHARDLADDRGFGGAAPVDPDPIQNPLLLLPRRRGARLLTSGVDNRADQELVGTGAERDARGCRLRLPLRLPLRLRPCPLGLELAGGGIELLHAPRLRLGELSPEIGDLLGPSVLLYLYSQGQIFLGHPTGNQLTLLGRLAKGAYPYVYESFIIVFLIEQTERITESPDQLALLEVEEVP